MAATATILLSSQSRTTVTPQYRSMLMPSSSPRLPSPSYLFARVPAISVHNQDISMLSAKAAREMPSATTLLPEESCLTNMETELRTPKSSMTNDSPQCQQPQEALPKAVECPAFNRHKTKASTVKSTSLKEDVGHPRNEKSSKTEQRKPRSKGVGVERQTKIRKAKITKPGSENVVPNNKQVGNTKKRRKISHGSTLNTLLGADDSKSLSEKESTLNLEEAVRRRDDWTPVKDTRDQLSILSERQILPTSPCIIENRSKNAKLGGLLGDYGFSASNDNVAAVPRVAGSSGSKGIIKGKRIELLSGSKACYSAAEKPRRSKSPKKKPQTITEKATAHFLPAEPESGGLLLQYINPLTCSDICSDPSRSKRITSTPKKAPRPKKPAAKKKSKHEITVLLSPETAVKRARDQDFIFGTSSQLERDESPTFLRDLQQAMKESEELKAPVEPWAKNDHLLSTQCGAQKTPDTLNHTQSRNLWTAASRDLEEELLQAEFVDLTHTPMPPKCSSSCQQDYVQSVDMHDQERVDQNSIKEACDSGHSTRKRPTDYANRIVASSHTKDNSKHYSRSGSPPKQGISATAMASEMPHYQGYTEAQLKKAVTSYGFKPIKKREAAIALLERCWESQRNIALRERPEAINQASPRKQPLTSEPKEKVPSPVKGSKRVGSAKGKPRATDTAVDSFKRPRGRPKKNTNIKLSPQSTEAMEQEAAESITSNNGADESAKPKAPECIQRDGMKKLDGSISKPPGSSSTVPPRRKKSKTADSRLFDMITNLITTCPPANDVKNLTWYEKILMYEPIVIEDLTAWLNEASVGEITNNKDGFKLVKEWCETRSVCCLWKENLRGGHRGRW